ncbi:MAG: hypothetical protein Fur0022_34410 [Anaerolineales bacterium]
MKTTLKPKRDNRQAYLVRMWRDSPQEPWRASVKAVANGREIYFVSPEKLFLFLHRQMAELAADDERTNQVIDEGVADER